MNNQKGATLVVALSLLTIITLVAVYTMESSTIQGRMISNSIITYDAFQETNNELMANVRFYDAPTPLGLGTLLSYEAGNIPDPLPTQSTPNNTNISNSLIYTGRNAPCSKDELGVDAPVECPIFEITSVGTFRNTVSNQSIGVTANKLAVTGTISLEN